MTAPPPWALFSWPTVFCQANLPGQPRFIHLSTRIVYSGDETVPVTGQTLWAQHLDDGEAGRVWVGPLAGVLAESIGWPAFFIISTVLAAPALVLLWWLRAAVQALDVVPGAHADD